LGVLIEPAQVGLYIATLPLLDPVYLTLEPDFAVSMSYPAREIGPCAQVSSSAPTRHQRP
jgi:hypothetical protein